MTGNEVQERLVMRAQGGDHDAFAILVNERMPRLYGVASLITGRHDVGEEAVQEALLKAWRDLPRLREVGRFDAWLHRLLVNACHDQGRRRRRHRMEVELSERHRGDAAASGIGLAERDELERAFLRLGAQDRAVIVLRHYLGFSSADAAAAMGMREGTLKSRLHRAMSAMSAALAAEARTTEVTTGGRPA